MSCRNQSSNNWVVHFFLFFVFFFFNILLNFGLFFLWFQIYLEILYIDIDNLADFDFCRKYEWLWKYFDSEFILQLQGCQNEGIKYKLDFLFDFLKDNFENFISKYNNDLFLLLNRLPLDNLEKMAKKELVDIIFNTLNISIDDIVKTYYFKHPFDFCLSKNNNNLLYFMDNKFFCDDNNRFKNNRTKRRILFIWDEKKYLYPPYKGSIEFDASELRRIGQLGSSNSTFVILMRLYKDTLQHHGVDIFYDMNNYKQCLPYNICPKIDLTTSNYNVECLGEVYFDRMIYRLTRTDWCILLGLYRDSLYKYCNCSDGDFLGMLRNESSNIHCKQLIW
jgi:hypothetical protein